MVGRPRRFLVRGARAAAPRRMDGAGRQFFCRWRGKDDAPCRGRDAVNTTVCSVAYNFARCHYSFGVVGNQQPNL
eukprot:gene17759-biopygen5366